MRGVVVRKIEAMLRVELLCHDLVIEALLSCLQQRRELPMPGGLVHALEKRLVAVSRRAQRNVRRIDHRHGDTEKSWHDPIAAEPTLVQSARGCQSNRRCFGCNAIA
jgi:hypothetical protein